MMISLDINGESAWQCCFLKKKKKIRTLATKIILYTTSAELFFH